jgi:predicted AAA+ superfamily ATPase
MNKIFYHSSTKVVEMGFSDHFALVMNILVKRPATFSVNIVKRVFSRRSIDIFNAQLKTELWEDVKHNRSGMVAVQGPNEALPYYIHAYMGGRLPAI